MILWSIIAGTRGGINRAKILNLIKDTPMNANKIATVLNLDHKTVVHHVKILSKNELVVKAEKEYGAEFHLTQIMKDNQSALEEIMQKIGTK
ncbi:winged helix-turn-helix domain-containing protein [Nitrosopumilus sp.]|uniref:winged helix-turn-helix domain-containing protein n=1 Tax=Nitrosopumilus sp. TaxID=2024843 RepID=UPI0026350926|nr:winged helix-turn-helix domain-containing protein [Nitrosopumilus sp.]